jgi:plastocyanin domain-containing protein
MTASLGILTLSAFMLKNKFMKKAHIGAGVALIGFSYWHHTLYQPKEQKAKTNETEAKGKAEVQNADAKSAI